MKPSPLLLVAAALPLLAACGPRSHPGTPSPEPAPSGTPAPTLTRPRWIASPTPGDTPPATLPAPGAAPAERPAGDTWTRPADEMVMVFVPEGGFQMGTDEGQMAYSVKLCGVTAVRTFGPGARCFTSEFSDETPAHTVTIDGFWIDRFEVTNAQYRRCVSSGACTPPAESGSFSRRTYYGDDAYDDYPVVWVGWQQAAAYCAWAGARLPSEAEWEYAARGPEARVFPWGDVFDGRRLNYCDVNCDLGPGDETINDGHADTAPVGSYPSGASWCGALDMAGNVREWVTDWFGPYHGRQDNPTGPRTGEMIVSRGGSWLDPPENVRSAKRGRNTTDFTIYKLGFRCAADDVESAPLPAGSTSGLE